MGLFNIYYVTKYLKKLKGDPFETLKNFRKKTKNRRIRSLSQSHSAEKLERGDPLGFSKLQFAVKYRKIRRGDPLDTKKISKKSRTVPKKTQRGDPIVSSGFVSYDKNGVFLHSSKKHQEDLSFFPDFFSIAA